MGVSVNRGGRRNQGIEGINVTPMVDIMLVLLVIYIVASEMGQGQVQVELPSSSQNAAALKHSPLRVVMQADGQLSMDGRAVSNQALQAEIAALPVERKKTVLLQADTKVSHGHVIKLMNLLSAAGVKDLSFATQQERQASDAPQK